MAYREGTPYNHSARSCVCETPIVTSGTLGPVVSRSCLHDVSQFPKKLVVVDNDRGTELMTPPLITSILTLQKQT
jgi:hypothetical protein